MKLKCLQCNHKFDGVIEKDDLGWHSSCPECGGSFDVDVPEGKIVVAFTDPIDDADEPYKPFDQAEPTWNIHGYYAFDSVEAFLQKWKEFCDEPYGMWYWVIDEGTVVCSGAVDPGDIEIFEDHWGFTCEEESDEG